MPCNRRGPGGLEGPPTVHLWPRADPRWTPAPTLGRLLPIGFITSDATLENAIRKRADLPERDDNSTFLDTPINVHQAISQRTRMTKSADKEAAKASPEELSRQDDALVENLMKALDGNYNGEA